MIRLITLYDSYLSNPKLRPGFGFSCYVEIDGKKILFDTGSDSATLLYNMAQLKIDPKSIDFVILSHNHLDHTGGLPGFLEANSNKAKVIEPATFLTPTAIAEGVYSTGALKSFFIQEQALVLKTKKGLVIITGCSHPGVVNLVKAAQQVDKRIYLVLGGFHIDEASKEINSFKKIGVQKVAPCHCTGNMAIEQFKGAYKENFITNGVGKIIEIEKERAEEKLEPTNAKIDSSTYGSITIDGVTYNHDVYIFPSGKVKERQYGHTFTKEQVEHVLKENPDTIVIGKGTSGMATLSDDARAGIEQRGIEIVEDNTPDIVDKFNKLAKTKRVAAIIHVTC